MRIILISTAIEFSIRRLKIFYLRVGEMVQWVRTLVATAEAQAQFPALT